MEKAATEPTGEESKEANGEQKDDKPRMKTQIVFQQLGQITIALPQQVPVLYPNSEQEKPDSIQTSDAFSSLQLNKEQRLQFQAGLLPVQNGKVIVDQASTSQIFGTPGTMTGELNAINLQAVLK
jgi:hypothetical protein